MATFTNKELGKLIYVALFGEPEDQFLFDHWYDQCWGEIMSAAVNAIGVGCGSYEEGTSIELKRKDFFFEKENFDEFLGETECFRKFRSTEQIEKDLIAYFCGGAISEYYKSEQEELFAEACHSLQALPCDPDEQEEAMDALLEEYSEKILDLM